MTHNPIPIVTAPTLGTTPEALSNTYALNLSSPRDPSQRVHIHYYYGVRSQKTIPTMVLGTLIPY